jgi:hypothetical protein
MTRLTSHRWWITVALLSLLAAACSPFGDDATPAQQPVTPLPTVVATAAATATATATPSPTATPEPYPGITMPVPSDDCDVTRLTGWRVVEGIQAAWIEGDGIDIGVPGGLLYEGENRLLLRGGDGLIEVSVAPIDRSLPDRLATPVAGIAIERHAASSYVTFESPGCWRIGVEWGDSRVNATVAVHPAACRLDAFDLATCPDPPYALHWNPDASAPAGCDLMAVAGVITGFVDAVNRADLDAALAFFPERDGESDIDTTGLRWFSLEKMVANDPGGLRPLLAALIDGGEQLRLLRIDLGWGWDGDVQFGIQMTRETDELLRYQIEGKGAINCELGQIYLFSAIRQP